MGSVASLDQRRPVRPKAIDTAFLFTITGIVLGSIGTVLTTLVDRARIAAMARDALSRSGRPYTEADVLAMIGPFRIAGAITIAVVAGALVLVAVKARAGRNWARLLLAVFALVGVFDFRRRGVRGGRRAGADLEPGRRRVRRRRGDLPVPAGVVEILRAAPRESLSAARAHAVAFGHDNP